MTRARYFHDALVFTYDMNHDNFVKTNVLEYLLLGGTTFHPRPCFQRDILLF